MITLTRDTDILGNCMQEGPTAEGKGKDRLQIILAQIVLAWHKASSRRITTHSRHTAKAKGRGHMCFAESSSSAVRAECFEEQREDERAAQDCTELAEFDSARRPRPSRSKEILARTTPSLADCCRTREACSASQFSSRPLFEC